MIYKLAIGAIASVVFSLLIGVIELPGVSDPSLHFEDVRLANGVRLRVAQQGASNGPAVLMLHGYPDSWYSFSRVLPLLPSNLRVIVPDQRGFGDSDRPADPSGYTIDTFARDAIQLMDALHVPRATVVGHSMGSFIARRVAELAKDRVTSLLLIGSATHAHNAVVKEFKDAVDAMPVIEAAFVREFQISTAARPMPAEFIDQVVRESLKCPPFVWKAALASLYSFEPSSEPLRVPTLVLGGEKDGLFSRAEQEALKTIIPGAAVQIYPGIGHSLQWDDPQLFVEQLTKFIAPSML
jgi:non-heme chloroperoxidase